MTKSELIARLSEYPDDMLIMILDGGGKPREINLGPTDYEIETEDIEYNCDCDGLVGKEVIIMGYGYY